MAASAALLVFSFLMGSLPTAYLAVRLGGRGDIRALGSGNVGATNAFRVLGLKGAIPVSLIDFAKGVLPVLLALRLPPYPGIPERMLALFCGSAAVLGHVFSPFMGFRGGKGVATGAGVMTALYPPLFPACIAVFAVSLAWSRRASLASLITAAALPLWYYALPRWLSDPFDPAVFIFTLAVAGFIVFSHRKNIRALLTGAEKRVF